MAEQKRDYYEVLGVAKDASDEDLRGRLYARVLPSHGSISLCEEAGLSGKHIIAMQGPFSTEMNEAILHQFEIACMVTKKSGRLGGYPEKLEAAKRAGIPVYVIEPADTERGYSMEEVCERLQILLCAEDGVTAGVIDNKMDIILAGIGMGASKGLTREVYDAIESADILLGAKRLIEPYKPHIEKKPYYLGKDIVPYL